MALCPATGRLTVTVATDLLVHNGGPLLQAVRMWTKQWSFTPAQGRDAATAGCTVGVASTFLTPSSPQRWQSSCYHAH